MIRAIVDKYDGIDVRWQFAPVMIALLSQASPQQLELVRELAAYISPRPGFTPHRLTIHAAAQMVRLVERAGDFADPQWPGEAAG